MTKLAEKGEETMANRHPCTLVTFSGGQERKNARGNYRTRQYAHSAERRGRFSVPDKCPGSASNHEEFSSNGTSSRPIDKFNQRARVPV